MLRDFAETGDYAADCRTGRQVADRLLAAMRERDDPAMLGMAIRKIVEHKRYSGIEVGFCHRLAERAMIGAK